MQFHCLRRLFFICFLGVLSLSFFVFVPLGFAQTVQELEARLNALRSRDAELARQSQEFQSLVTETNQEIRSIRGEISSLSYEINSLETEIARSENAIELTNLEIQKLTLELTHILSKIEDSKEKTGQLLAQLYQAEQFSPAETILSGQDFSDLWDKQQYLANFQNSLNGLLLQMSVLRDELTQKRQQQELYRADLESLRQQKSVQQSILDDQRGQQKVLLSQSEQERSQYQAQVNRTEQSRKGIIEEILRIEEEVKRLRNFDFYVKSGKIPPPGTKIFAWPSDAQRVTQGYGRTSFARSGTAGYTFHNGVDIGGPIGTPVKAAADGKVIGRNTSACPNYSSLRNFGCQGGWGNWIAIQHANDLVTLYTHLAKPTPVPVGATVQTGELIGFIGSSGNVTGPHLHFSVYTEFFLVPSGYPGYNPEGTLNPLSYL